VAVVAVVISPVLVPVEELQPLVPVPVYGGDELPCVALASYACNDVFSFEQKQRRLFPTLQRRIDKKFLLSYLDSLFGLTERVKNLLLYISQ
jgi:hypothetical protein